MKSSVRSRVGFAICAGVLAASLSGSGLPFKLSDAEVMFREAHEHLGMEQTPQVFAYHYDRLYAEDPDRAWHLAVQYFWLVEDDVLLAALFPPYNGTGNRTGGTPPLRAGNAPVTKLSFTNTAVVATGAGKVFRAAAAWPQSQDIPQNKLVVISTPLLAPAYWGWFDEVEVDPLQENATLDLPMDNGMAFFRLATLTDTTGSGVPDVYEWIEQTNPQHGDADGDGLADWYEEWIGTDPENPYSIVESDPTNPDYYDEFGNPLTDGEIVAMWHEPKGGGHKDDTPPEWNGLIGLDLTLCDTDFYDDTWILMINVPFRSSPYLSAPEDYSSIALTNLGDVTKLAERTIYVKAGQNVTFRLIRVETGQTAGTDEFSVTIDAFIPSPMNTLSSLFPSYLQPMYANYGSSSAPNWLPSIFNPEMSASVNYGSNGEPPDVSGYVWNYTGYMLTEVKVDGDEYGKCVLAGTPITMRCTLAPDVYLAHAYLPDYTVAWQFRQKNFQGGWDEWEDIGTAYVSMPHTYAPQKGGVFGIRARFLELDYISPIYRRQKDEPCCSVPAAPNSEPNAFWRKGQPNAVGVCDTPFQLDLRSAARGMIGDGSYALNKLLEADFDMRPYQSGIWKCNIFVAHMCRLVDMDSVPLIERRFFNPLKKPMFRKEFHPPLASEWFSGFSTLWSISDNLQPGLVITTGEHMGITDYDGVGIGAGGEIVHKAYNFFEELSAYRRYK